MTDEDIALDGTPVEQEDLELFARSIARFGPTEREQAICRDLYRDQKSEHDEAWRYCVAPRTMRNMARVTRDRLAAEMADWDLLSLAELHEERWRVVRLRQMALRAFEDSQQEEPRLRHRGGAWRYLEIAVRLGSLKRRMATEIRERTRREAEVAPGTADLATPVSAAPTLSDTSAVNNETHRRAAYATVAGRRRKILRGRRLRLPRFDRSLLLMRPAAAWRAVLRRRQALERGGWRTGIPPPRASEALIVSPGAIGDEHAARRSKRSVAIGSGLNADDAPTCGGTSGAGY